MSKGASFPELLQRYFSQISEAQVCQLYEHFKLLELWNRKLNLTAIRSVEEAVVRHYCESLFLGNLLPGGTYSVADIGSGAGFPGIPIAILRPDSRVTLIESHKRKAVFLSEATRSLANVRVLARRAEEVNERFDWAVCRAVKWSEALPELMRLASRVAFLTSEAEGELIKAAGVSWEEPVKLPWGERRIAVLGQCAT